jgi:hypothetical protein
LRRIPRTEKPRNQDEDVKPELYPIACGLLGRSGGFLYKDFRAHDFQLGRRNCQQFLHSFFWVPADNVIVGGPATDDRKPIIPLVGAAADPVPMPRWPQMKLREFDRVCDRMKARIDAVAPVLIGGHGAGAGLWFAMALAWRFLLCKKTLSFLRTTMLAELVRHRQIEGWEAPPSLVESGPRYEQALTSAAVGKAAIAHKDRSPDDVQAVIAELVNQAPVFQTPAAVAATMHLPSAFVAAVLDALSKPGIPISPRIRTWTDGKVFSLDDRCPWRIKIMSLVGAFFRR